MVFISSWIPILKRGDTKHPHKRNKSSVGAQYSSVRHHSGCRKLVILKTPIGLPKAGDITDNPNQNFLQFVYNPTPKWIRARMKDPFQQNEAGESKAGLHLSALNAPNEKGPQLSVLTTP